MHSRLLDSVYILSSFFGFLTSKSSHNCPHIPETLATHCSSRTRLSPLLRPIKFSSPDYRLLESPGYFPFNNNKKKKKGRESHQQARKCLWRRQIQRKNLKKYENTSMSSVWFNERMCEFKESHPMQVWMYNTLPGDGWHVVMTWQQRYDCAAPEKQPRCVNILSLAAHSDTKSAPDVPALFWLQAWNRQWDYTSVI